MSPFPLKGVPTRPHKHMHRLLQRSTNEASTPALSSSLVPQFGTVSVPSSNTTSTQTFTRTTSTPPLVSTISAPRFTPSSTTAPSSTFASKTTFTSATSTPPMFGTLSMPSSTPTPSSSPSSKPTPLSTPLYTPAPSLTPSPTPLPSSTPSSRAAPTTPLDEQNETRIDGRLCITVQAKERKGVVGGKVPPTHNGGSASHKQIVGDIEEYTRTVPSVYDVKTFLDEKAKKVHDFIESRRADFELLGEEVDENELFYTAVVGHDHKRRVYGLGSYGRSIFHGNSSEACTSPDTNSEKHHLEANIQKLEETIEQQRVELDEVRNTINAIRNMIN
ncbi:unnamed protein product [Lactuca virosa]|uniref:Uncharacterized protein n=1 Tax=Lactuca virosa TaxID=75947 RepID=A0AAU9N9A4_9ASTR|nr:unnamed protein product [Lactuca virosa]